MFEEQEEVEWLEGRGGAGAWGPAGTTCTFLKGLAQEALQLWDLIKGLGLLKENESVSHPVVSNPLRLHGLQPARLLCPWDSSGKNTGVGCHALLQGIFLSQGPNLHCRPILYRLNHQGRL